MPCEHKTPTIQLSLIDEFLYGAKKNKRCRICRHEIYKKNYQKHKEKIFAKNAEYRKNNPDKIKVIKNRYYKIVTKNERKLDREVR